mgnify:CR=1 FL=1
MVDHELINIRQDEQINLHKLKNYLNELLKIDINKINILQFSGGHANLTYLISFNDKEFVLRRPPLGPVAPSSHDMAREHMVQHSLNKLFPLAPKSIHLCEDDKIIGSKFHLIERKKGIVIRKEDKKLLLKHLINEQNIEHALVFTRTKHGADKVVKDLKRDGITAMAIHGNKSQNERVKALNRFKDKSIRMLIATDVASRGIDVEKLGHVINFDIPEQAESYVHRIGRTGRAGENGTAISFCSLDEMVYLKDIQKLIKNNIDVERTHPYSLSAEMPVVSKARPSVAKPHFGKKTHRRRRAV